MAKKHVIDNMQASTLPVICTTHAVDAVGCHVKLMMAILVYTCCDTLHAAEVATAALHSVHNKKHEHRLLNAAASGTIYVNW